MGKNYFKNNIKELTNLRGNVDSCLSLSNCGTIPVFYPVQEISFNNKTFLYIQAENSGEYVIVPGFKNSKEYQTKEGKSAVEVIPISDEKDRKEISNLLKNKTEGKIIFW